MLNSMCIRCAHLGIDCKGTENQVWSGCVYKEDVKQALKRTLAELEILEMEANKADAAYDAEPENAEIQAAFDAAYKAEWDKADEAIKLIVKMTNGEIEYKIARIMINEKRDKIKKLLAQERKGKYENVCISRC